MVIACGAAAGSVRELEGDLLPTQLQGHACAEPVPDIAENGWPDGAPGVLGSPYIAPLAPERVLVGTTKEYGASVADARRAGEIPLADAGSAAAASAAAARELVESAAATHPLGRARRRGAWTWRVTASARTRRGRAWGRCRWSGASSRGSRTRTETGAG